MKTLTLALALVTVLLPAAPVCASQDASALEIARVESVEVAGFDLGSLSPGLQGELRALAGRPVGHDALTTLARRIEQEHPDVVAAVRTVEGREGTRVVFLVARIDDSEDVLENINARYVVEDVDVSGVSEDRLSAGLRADLMALEGASLDPRALGHMNQRLRDELPHHEVDRRISRGSEPGSIRIVFDVRRSEQSRRIRFEPSRSKLVFYESQGWSGVFDVPLGSGRGDNRVSLDLVRGNTDDLVEEYTGIGLRLQNRNAGTERIGLGLELSRYTQTWREASLDAFSQNPTLFTYRKRVTVLPTVTVAPTRLVSVRTGFLAAELTPFSDDRPPARVNAAVIGIAFDSRAAPGSNGQRRVIASYEYSEATAGLGSDLVYRRGLGQASLRLERGDRTFIAAFQTGHISGSAPLFERFSLGDSRTLRGWNKYDIAPAGADRMWHQSTEVRFDRFAYFVDAGSQWSAGEARRIRFSTGIGFHHDNAFLTVAFPLNADKVQATVLFGVRF